MIINLKTSFRYTIENRTTNEANFLTLHTCGAKKVAPEEELCLTYIMVNL